jgi:diadenosine tetraphosphate (Ap4A) HIT family hydrolase
MVKLVKKSKLKRIKEDYDYEKNCLFCDFVKGNWKKHRNKFVFEKLHETKRTLSFLSIDFPSPAEMHILVIPKKHYVNLEDMPKTTMHELIEHVSLASKAIRIENSGCNVLLNDGRDAEQTVMHTHFHIIPRNKNDEIEIELWKRLNITQKRFSKLNKRAKELFRKAKKLI